jgi:hypothetical protein
MSIHTVDNYYTTPCFTPMGVYKKLATLNPKNIPVKVISIDIKDIMKMFFSG